MKVEKRNVAESEKKRKGKAEDRKMKKATQKDEKDQERNQKTGVMVQGSSLLNAMICNKAIVIHDLIDVAYKTDLGRARVGEFPFQRDGRMGFMFGTRCEFMPGEGGMTVITWDNLRLICFRNCFTNILWLRFREQLGCCCFLLPDHLSCCIVTFLPEMLDSIIILAVACSRLIVRGHSTYLRQLMSL